MSWQPNDAGSFETQESTSASINTNTNSTASQASQIQALKKQCAELEKERAVLTQTVEQLQSQIKDSKEREQNLNSINSAIMTSLNDFSNQTNHGKEYKQLKNNYEADIRKLVDGQAKLQTTIASKEAENIILRETANETRLQIKDLEIALEKERINKERAMEVGILDRTIFENDVHKHHLQAEEDFQQARLALEAQLDQQSAQHDREMQEINDKYCEDIRQMQASFEKEKMCLEGRITKNLNTIKKYQAHIEQNGGTNGSFFLQNQSRLDISMMKTEQSDQSLEKISQLRNEISKLTNELAFEKNKAVGLQETVEALRLKLFSYEGACDINRNTKINNVQVKKSQNIQKARPRSEHEARRSNISMSQVMNSKDIGRLQQSQQQQQLYSLEIQKLSEINNESHNTNNSFFTNQTHQDIQINSRNSQINKKNHLLAGLQENVNVPQENHKQNQNQQQQQLQQQQQQQPYLNQPLLMMNQGQQSFLESLESQSQEQYLEWPQQDGQQYQDSMLQQQQSQFLSQAFLNSKSMDTHSSNLCIDNDNRYSQQSQLHKQYVNVQQQQMILPIIEQHQQQQPYQEQYYHEDQLQSAQNQQYQQQQILVVPDLQQHYFQQPQQQIKQHQQQPQYYHNTTTNTNNNIQQYPQTMASLLMEETNHVSPGCCDSTQRIQSISNNNINHYQQQQNEGQQLNFQDQEHIQTDQLDFLGQQSNSLCNQFEQMQPEQQYQQSKPSYTISSAKHNPHRKPPNIPPLMIVPQENSSITMNRIQQSQAQQQQYQQQQYSHRSQRNIDTLQTDRISSARQSDNSNNNKPQLPQIQLSLTNRTNNNTNDRYRTTLKDINDSSNNIKNKSLRCNSLNMHAIVQSNQVYDNNIIVDQQGTLQSNRQNTNLDNQKVKKGQLDYKTLLQCQHCRECVIPNELIDHMATCNFVSEMKAITDRVNNNNTQRNEAEDEQQVNKVNKINQQIINAPQEQQQQQEVLLTQQSDEYIKQSQQQFPSEVNELFTGDNNKQQHQQSQQFWSVIEQLSAEKQAVEWRLKELEEQQQARRSNSMNITNTARNRSTEERLQLKQQLHDIKNQQVQYSNQINQMNINNQMKETTTIHQSRSANQRSMSLLNQRSNNSINLSKQLATNNISKQLSQTVLKQQLNKESLPPRLSINLSKPTHNINSIQLTSFIKKPIKPQAVIL